MLGNVPAPRDLPTSSAATGELAALAPHVERIRAASASAFAPATRRAYGSSWAQFLAWADGEGLQALPAPPAAVAAYLAHRSEDGRSLATPAWTGMKWAGRRADSPLFGLACSTGDDEDELLCPSAVGQRSPSMYLCPLSIPTDGVPNEVDCLRMGSPARLERQRERGARGGARCPYAGRRGPSSPVGLERQIVDGRPARRRPPSHLVLLDVVRLCWTYVRNAHVASSCPLRVWTSGSVISQQRRDNGPGRIGRFCRSDADSSSTARSSPRLGNLSTLNAVRDGGLRPHLELNAATRSPLRSQTLSRTGHTRLALSSPELDRPTYGRPPSCPCWPSRLPPDRIAGRWAVDRQALRASGGLRSGMAAFYPIPVRGAQGRHSTPGRSGGQHRAYLAAGSPLLTATHRCGPYPVPLNRGEPPDSFDSRLRVHGVALGERSGWGPVAHSSAGSPPSTWPGSRHARQAPPQHWGWRVCTWRFAGGPKVSTA